MIRTIVWRELLSHLISLRFAVCLVLCTALSTASCYLLTEEYGKRLAQYNADRTRSREALQQVQVYAFLRPEVHRPPAVLSVLAEGVDRKMGTKAAIAVEEVPFALTGGQATNEFAPVFPILDFATVVSVVLSLLALLLAYDSISGEKERGTLRMCLANACPRHQLLLGKYLGGLLALGVSLLVALVLCLLIISAHPAIALTLPLLGKVGLIFLAALLALSCFLLLGLWVSARTQRSFTSLIVLLFVWVLTVFVLPKTGAYAALQFCEVEGRKGIEYQVKQLLQEAVEKVDAYSNTIEPHRLWAAMTGRTGVGGIPWRLLPAGNPYPTLEYYRKQYAYAAPLYAECAEQGWNIRRRREEELVWQQQVAEGFRFLSPAALFVRAARRIAGTDVDLFRRFMEELRRYRRQLIASMEERQLFSAYAFTSLYEPSPEEDLFFARSRTLRARMEQMRQQAQGMQQDSREFKQLLAEGEQVYEQWWEQVEREKQQWEEYLRTHPQRPVEIDLKGMPVFEGREMDFREAAGVALPFLLILGLYNILLFLVAHVAFLRGDVR